MSTKKRRLNGDGSFKKRKNGTWEYKISVPGQYDGNGKQLRLSTYGRTQKEARDKAQIKLNQYATGTVYSKDDITVSELAKAICGDKLDNGDIQEQTYARHMETLKRLAPIGNIKVVKIQPKQIKDFLKSHRGYSDSTIIKEYQMLKGVFREALKRKIVAKDPMLDISCPKSAQIREDVRALTIGEMRRFIDVLNNENVKYSAPMLISLYTGLRMGEVLALAPHDVDLNNKILHVNKTVSMSLTGSPFINRQTKTYAGKRDLRINDDLCRFFENLISDSRSADLIFTDDNGRLVSTTTVNARFSAVVKKYDILTKIDGKKVTLHSLRHTYATRCIESGMQAKVLQHRLGHKDITVTYNVYGDVFTLYEDACLDIADEYFRSIGVQLGYASPQTPENKG